LAWPDLAGHGRERSSMVIMLRGVFELNTCNERT
jgi:hypothetical protein